VKRDMELCRRILIELESKPFSTGLIEIEFDDVSPEDVAYHIKLLKEAGLIDAEDISTMGRLRWRAKSITWDGHDFIEAIKDDSRWSKAKDFVIEGGKVVTLETIKLAVKSLFL
jgi:DNA-binding transcriptional ArsR family regulator